MSSDSWQATVKRKASFMAIEDYIDIRDSMGPECQFKIDV
jgi:hypothetical protein